MSKRRPHYMYSYNFSFFFLQNIDKIMFSIFFIFFYSQDQAMKKESGKYFENLKYFIL